MKQVLHSAIGAACAVGAFLAGTGLVLAAGSSAAADAGAGATPAQALSQDAGVTGTLPAREVSKDAGTAEPAAMPQPAADAAAAGPAPEPPPPAKTEAPPVEQRQAPPAAKPPKKNVGLMLGGSGVALAGAAAMGIGLYYLHVDGRPVCRAGEVAPCDFERDTRTFGDVMLASGSGVFLLGAAAFFWGFYSDTTAVAVTPTGMVVTRRF
jgi:hypothetical protein